MDITRWNSKPIVCHRLTNLAFLDLLYAIPCLSGAVNRKPYEPVCVSTGSFHFTSTVFVIVL